MYRKKADLECKALYWGNDDPKANVTARVLRNMNS
jgi:hypothetical protein